MKKIIALLISLFILLSLTIPAFAADGLPYVVDNADLLTAEEESTLETYLESESTNLNFDIVVVTVDSLEGKTAEAYADDYYDYTGYGYGQNHDGCLLLVSMSEREWHISTTGYGITALTDAGIDYISNHFLDDLSDGDYMNAFKMYAYLVSVFVEQSYSGDAYDYNNLDEYDPYYDADDYSDGNSKQSLGIVCIAGIVGGIIIAIIVVSVLKGKMKTVYHKAQANDYLVRDSFELTGSHDIFITSHVTKTAKESKSSGGGSSTHSGSSGTSHGGGGGHF